MTLARFRSPKWITAACPKARCGCSYGRPTDPMAQRCTPGQLIRRHRFPSPDGGYLKSEDWKSCGEMIFQIEPDRVIYVSKEAFIDESSIVSIVSLYSQSR